MIPESPTVYDQIRVFLEGGGVFMGFILLSSVVALSVILQRMFALRWKAHLPPELVHHIDQLRVRYHADDVTALAAHASDSRSALGRIVASAFELRREDPVTLRNGVEAVAREQIVRLQSGMPVLEVVITIAPLLGLLGTVSGLISVFGVFGGAGALADPDPALIASGIAEALYTTIGGLAVAVPVVIAHSYLNKKIERMSVRMEVLLSIVVQAIHASIVPAPEEAVTPAAAPQPVRQPQQPQVVVPTAQAPQSGGFSPAPIRTRPAPTNQ